MSHRLNSNARVSLHEMKKFRTVKIGQSRTLAYKFFFTSQHACINIVRRICNYPAEIDLLRESLMEGDFEALMATRGMSLTSRPGHMSTGPGTNGFGYGPIADGNKEVVVA